MRHPGEGEAPGLARSSMLQFFHQQFLLSIFVTHISWIGSRGGLKFTKSSERPKVRLENRKSADLENRLNLKSADEEVKGNTEEEGNFYFNFFSLQELWHMTEQVYLNPTGTVRGILKAVSSPSKPPVPSRSRVNAVLGVGCDKDPIGNTIMNCHTSTCCMIR